MQIIINANCEGLPKHAVEIPCCYDFLHNVLTSMGYQSQKPPLADLLRKYHSLNGDWLIVSPIHWHATFKDVTIAATGHDLNLAHTDGLSLFNLMQKEFPEMRWHYHDQYTWLVQTDKMVAIDSQPPHLICNTSCNAHLKNLDKTLYWQKFLTMSQLLLASIPKVTSNYLINGLWVWGQGKLLVNQHHHITYDDKALLPIVNILTNNSQIITNKSIIILQDPANIPKKTANAKFYWNNLAYQKQSGSWLLRKLQNAYSA